MREKPVSPGKSVLVFSLFTALFYFLLVTLHPLLRSVTAWNPALYWFVTGYFLFVPMAVYAVGSVRREGFLSGAAILRGLGVRNLSPRDWKYSIMGLLILFLCTGLIFGVSHVLSSRFGLRELSTTPWFIEMHPFQGLEKLLLLIWFPMFCFNILGEELLWRGYIQKRLSARYAWPLCSLLWFLFHLPFGGDLMIILLPITIIVPFVFYRTRNTAVAIFIHGMYNGPIFVAVALGLVS
ncbi:hypothetical protein AU468_08010 [Alkalispirochaeta sphaeroplastigenens]|uniref:CAAX prenyl protease 2/Lysostaphin resistance protein A-like domain-containing protein n=1 Tax=Alkalispirochaeta sphaeroplastigenens TaxID=1187066 RepID=A0A2S4JPP0_9SPIO|nr:type II CAAX endopeptidase family protein [Alkalispirochaeta sphaeroplastigenens]POR01498.1 hypothetical protein AU468_08010 [Alkalispirochaeta sphaeroplastigenens]